MADVGIGAALGESLVKLQFAYSRFGHPNPRLFAEKLEGSTITLRNDGLEGR